jgi:hypothetical protein
MKFDGASDSKPASGFDTEPTSTRTHNLKPSKLRRYMSISSRRRNQSNKSGTDNANEIPHKQTVPPRPTDFKPWAKKREGDLAPQGHLPVTEDPSQSISLPVAKMNGDGSEGPGDLPMIGDPYHSVQMQPRRDSVFKSARTVSTSPSRTAALTSHPVGKEDLESEEEFQTPGEFWGRKKGDYLQK